MKIIDKRKIRLVAVARRYMTDPFPALPAQAYGTYLTGQHIDPNKPETRGNLTVDEMTGKAPISEEKMKKFGRYIIDPKKHLLLENLREYDLSKYEDGSYVNPRDVQQFNFARNFCSNVAPNKTSVNPSTHSFYLEDKEADAIAYNTFEDNVFDAEELIRKNCPISEYKNKAMLLNYRVQNYHLDIEVLSDSQIKAELIKLCKKEPHHVLACFGPKAEEDLYILKLVNYGILTMKDGSFFDGSYFVGDSIDKVREFIKNPLESNNKYANKWGRLILEKDGKLPPQSLNQSIAPPLDPENKNLAASTSDPNIEFFKKMGLPELQEYCRNKKYAKAEFETFKDDENQLREYVLSRYLRTVKK